MKRCSIGFALVLVTLAAACGEHPEAEPTLTTTAETSAPDAGTAIGTPVEALADDSTSSDASAMTLETSCVATVCDAMQASAPSVTCADSDRTTCTSTSWDFEVQGAADATYEAACEAWVDHATSCGETGLDPTDCATWAKLERPELVSVYQCEAAEACDATTACDEPSPGTFGDEVCARLTALSGEASCNPDAIEELDEVAGWLRDDVLTTGRACLKALNVDDLGACVQAWLTAVTTSGSANQ